MLNTSEEIRANFHLSNHPTEHKQDLLDTSEEIRPNSLPGTLGSVRKIFVTITYNSTLTQNISNHQRPIYDLSENHICLNNITE